MAPTTLVTFLVRTPPSTGSVALYGSWDNFSTPYPMQRDARTGPEHWSGCHSFSNIICDGHVLPSGSPRNGGLKMGGTYWYYYKLDDDLEFHNSAEPSTTVCPLLPGQLVNVLNVPFALSSGTSGSRHRNDSVSSTSSEIHTMDPSDKFLNPRPVPARPTLPRLKTSPSFPSTSWSSDNSPVSAGFRRGRSVSSRGPSQPGSANTLRIIRLTKKSSLEFSSRSSSRSSNRSVGIIGAFKALASPRTTSPDAFSERGRSAVSDRSRGFSKRSITPRKNLITQTPPIPETTGTPNPDTTEAVLRKDHHELTELNLGLAISSFQQHRRQRSQSHEQSSLRNSLSAEEPVAYKTLDHPITPYKPLETLNEVITPVWPLTAIRVEGENVADEMQSPTMDLGKRLPTLPNSPSSAYPPSSVADDSPVQSFEEKLANLQSHFSATTIDTESFTASYIDQGPSRFSDWTCSTSRASPRSEYAASFIDIEPMSPAELDFEAQEVKPTQTIDRDGNATLDIPIASQDYSVSTPGGLPSMFSFSTVSSVDSSATPSSNDMPDGWSRFQHYSLPDDEVESSMTLKQAASPKTLAPLVVGDADRTPGYKSRLAPLDEPAMPHSNSMQQLLDELRYLGDIIQHH